MEIQRLILPDGRALAYSEYGDPHGFPVFYAHGSPGSRLEGAMFTTAARRGLRIIATDRPGMGHSTLLPGRTLLDHPRDIAALADALGIERFGAIGWSGGGPHTLACTYALAERLAFTIIIAGYTNFAELPGAADLLQNPADRLAVRLARRQPALFRLAFDLLSYSLRMMPDASLQAVLQSGNATDRALLDDPAFHRLFHADQHEAARQGGRGMAIDTAIQYHDWGFRLRDIGGRVLIFHGADDRIVPLAFSRHLARHLPRCELRVAAGQGHFFPVTHADAICEIALAELEQAPSR